MKTLDELTKESLKTVWQKNHDIIRYNFGLRLFQYSQGKVFDYSIHKNTNILPDDDVERTKIIKKFRSVRETSTVALQFQRLLIGSNGIFIHLSPSKCNLKSKSAIKDKSNTVDDHIMGVTSIAKHVISIYRKDYLKIQEHKDWSKIAKGTIERSISRMCENWLPKNLWLWSQCRITKEEHNKDRLPRGTKSYSVDEKRRLEHYKAANIEICSYHR
tara:strand:+ start:761 stop:1408 length:648 start_codon:yes stop_codon:yes gene_type:complete